jgi:hypothetical protein
VTRGQLAALERHLEVAAKIGETHYQELVEDVFGCPHVLFSVLCHIVGHLARDGWDVDELVAEVAHHATLATTAGSA